MLLLLFGSTCGTVVVLADTFSEILTQLGLYRSPPFSAVASALGRDRAAMAVVTLGLLLPLSLPRRMRSLEFAAMASLPVLGIVLAVLAYDCIAWGFPGMRPGELSWVEPVGGSKGIMEAISILGFAFYIQPVLMPLLAGAALSHAARPRAPSRAPLQGIACRSSGLGPRVGVLTERMHVSSFADAEMPGGSKGLAITQRAVEATIFVYGVLSFLLTGFLGAAAFGSDTEGDIMRNRLLQSKGAYIALQVAVLFFVLFSTTPIILGEALPFSSSLTSLLPSPLFLLPFLLASLPPLLPVHLSGAARAVLLRAGQQEQLEHQVSVLLDRGRRACARSPEVSARAHAPQKRGHPALLLGQPCWAHAGDRGVGAARGHGHRQPLRGGVQRHRRDRRLSRLLRRPR